MKAIFFILDKGFTVIINDMLNMISFFILSQESSTSRVIFVIYSKRGFLRPVALG